MPPTAKITDFANSSPSNIIFTVDSDDKLKMYIDIDRLDASTTPSIKEKVDKLAKEEKEYSSVEVDLAKVTFMDSIGIGFLLHLNKALKIKDQIKISLVGCCNRIKDTLELLVLHRVFNIQ